MHRIAFLLGFLLLCHISLATPIDSLAANKAGRHYLLLQGVLKASDTLTLYKTVSFKDTNNRTVNCYYIFNWHSEGFVIVGSDDRCYPIIGYSQRGSFDDSRLPPNTAAWLEQCTQEIASGIRNNAPENEHSKKLWSKLLSDSICNATSSKSDSYLLASTWEQGDGYNRYCPVMNGNHVVVGCVATSMAQIIRYHQYPSRGFGQKSYLHEAYGQLGVDFDTVDYDYSIMPDEVWYGSADEAIDMVSRLCYHCGVVVNMTYQYAGHSNGSGAQNSRFSEGLRHFGYTDVKYYERLSLNNDSLWCALIENEIDNLRPIEYSGFGDDGGHAFVLDGYNGNGQYHFNWGWGGYCDGFYSLTTMCGFTSNHSMNIHIQPSGWDGHLDRFYVSTNGNGNGTSWNEANKNLEAAITLNSLVSRDIWIKEGTYYGNMDNDYAFLITNPVSLTGGFAGHETAANQRNAELHPVIFDGQGQHGILYARLNSSNAKNIRITDITFQSGYSSKGSCVNLKGQVIGNYLIVRDCLSDSGSIVNLSDCKLRMCIFEDNQAPTICRLDGATLRQSLVKNNNAGRVLDLEGRGRVVNSDIVGNTGIGVVFNHPRNTFVNNIVWNNDTTLRLRTELPDTAIRHCGLESDTNLADSTCVRLGRNNEDGPRFIQPSSRGREGSCGNENYRLQRGSICLNAGERLPESIQDGDLDRSIRCRDGYIDLGCYESNYLVDINTVNKPSSLKVYPNPATTTITVRDHPFGTIRLYDASGRLVIRQQCGNPAVLDISSLSQGTYYLSDGILNQKIVKK